MTTPETVRAKPAKATAMYSGTSRGCRPKNTLPYRPRVLFGEPKTGVVKLRQATSATWPAVIHGAKAIQVLDSRPSSELRR